MVYNLCAPCLFGLEKLVSNELKQLDIENVVAENGKVYFSGDKNIVARANICSRFAERILIVVGKFKATSFEELFENVKSLNWADYISENDAFPVKGYSINSTLFSIPDCQKIIKKAIVDSLSSNYKIDWFEETGVIKQVQFSIIKDEVVLMIDTSGVALHKRGYRLNSNDAPLKETLAAALCSLSYLKHYHTLIDPFCGSGTILIEGALLANNIAPGLNREFVSQHFDYIGSEVFEIEKNRAINLQKTNTDFKAIGYDIDKKCVQLTIENAKIAGVDKFITVNQCDFKDLQLEEERATLITNPPYGERLLDINAAEELYRVMGEKFISKRGWSYGVLSPDEKFEELFRKKSDKRRKLYNGMIKCQYYMYFK